MTKPKFQKGDKVVVRYYEDIPLFALIVRSSYVGEIGEGCVYEDGEQYEYDVILSNGEKDSFFEKWLEKVKQ